MQDLFGTQLTITAQDAFEAVVSDLCRWSWRKNELLPAVVWHSVPQTFQHGNETITWTTIGNEADCPKAFSVLWLRPDDKNEALLWRISGDVTLDGEGVTRLTLRVARESTKFQLAPAPYTFRVPKIISQLLERWPGQVLAGEEVLQLADTKVSSDDVEYFWNKEVLRTDRVLPVLVLAHGARDAGVQLSRQVAGVLRVFVLASPMAATRLRAIVPWFQAVPWDGARLYWPPPAPLAGPYWLPDQISKTRGGLVELVTRSVAGLSATMVPRDAVMVALLERRRERLALHQDKDANELFNLVTLQKQELEGENRRLKAKVEQLEYQFQQKSLRQGLGRDEVRLDDDALPHTWTEFQEQLPLLESDSLVFTERARLDAGPKNSYPDPGRMFEFLRKLGRAADAWSQSKGNIGQRLEDWMQQEVGAQIALTAGELPDSIRRFLFEGSLFDASPHVKVDDAKPRAECGRIYFAIDNEKFRFIVNYLGPHP